MSKTPERIRWRPRIGLRSIIMLTAVVAVLVAVIAQPYRHRSRQRRLIAEAEGKGVTIVMRGFWTPKWSLGKTVLTYFDSSFSAPDKLYDVYLPAGKVTDEDLAEIACLEHVQRLHLEGHVITDQSLQHVAHMQRLRMLTLKDTSVTDKGIMHLAGVTSLVALDTDGADISYAALERLDAQLPLAHVCESRAIADLQAAGFQVPATPKMFKMKGPGSVEVILNADLCAEHVIIGMNREIHATADDMVLLSYLQRMQVLEIHTVTFDAGAFNSLRPLTSLRSLSIANSNITDDDLQALSRQSQLEQLHILTCHSITDTGLLHLTSLTRLKKLRVCYCDEVRGAITNQFRPRLPDCEIEIELTDAQRRKGQPRVVP